MQTKLSIAATNKKRALDFLAIKFRIFECPEFHNPKGRKKVLGEMPNLEGYQLLRKEQANDRTADIAPEMRPCYEEPLLSAAQELHLFRKMNYFQFLAQKTIQGINPDCVRTSRLDRIDGYMKTVTAIRNHLATANFRLVAKILREQPQKYRERNYSEGLISDLYMDVLKAVDYFDYTKGWKFSTYCTWVMIRNSSRIFQSYAKYNDHFSTGYDDPFGNVADEYNDNQAEVFHDANQKLVNRLLSILENTNTNSDVHRQIFAIKEWFGLENSQGHRTLEAISKDLNITKERVRQLKEKGIETLRQRVKELNLTFDR